jgi:predicted phosphodiesterase
MNQTDRILFAGDPHGNFEPLVTAVKKHKPEAVVLLGDYDLERPLESYLHEIIGQTEILWIAGNHDFESHSKYTNLFNSALAQNELHLKVKEVAGIRIAGLGGIFLGRVWYPPQPPKWTGKSHYLQKQPGLRQPGMSLKYQSAIWFDEVEAFKTLKADILVTHEAPGSHRHGFRVIDEIGLAMGVKNIFHGHLHENYSCTIRRKIKVTGVANKEVVDLLGNKLSK